MSEQNEELDTAVTQQRPTIPMLSVSRVSMFFVIATILWGQAAILQELGAYQEGLRNQYLIAILAALLWTFWPQIRVSLHMAIRWLRVFLSNRDEEVAH